MKPHYEQMARYLWSSTDDTICLTFNEIEHIISGELPRNTKLRPESWSNNPGGFGMTRMWLAAGYKTSRTDIGGQRVTFRRVNQHVSDECWRRVIRIALDIDLPARKRP